MREMGGERDRKMGREREWVREIAGERKMEREIGREIM